MRAVGHRTATAGVVVAALIVGCGDSPPRGPSSGQPRSSGADVGTERPDRLKWPDIAAYEPDAAEAYQNGKRLAGRIALRALTYPRGASAERVAARLTSSRSRRRQLARILAPGVDPDARSVAEVVYPQLSGVTPTSLGAMVVARQRMERPAGKPQVLTRVVDVRLRRSGGPWSLDRIGSVGGRPIPRPTSLSPAAEGVVDNPRITLSDSARWDIYGGEVDDALLTAMARLAQRHRFSVAVLSNGHPKNVWDTSRLSAHSRGAAADVYAVDGKLVVRQRESDSAAYALAASLVEGGAAQVGSPWRFGPDGRRSFTDAVHQDHVHVQWSAAD